MKNLLNKIFNIVFSEVGVILGMSLIIFYVLSSSFNDIRERLGFETMNSVKIELEQTKQKLKLAQQENIELKKMKDISDQKCDILNKVIEDYDNSSDKIDIIIDDVINDYDVENIANVSDSVETDNNIVKIHNVYDQLFGRV